jgi:hypothetical protein
MASASKFFLDFINKIGVATSRDIDRLQKQIDEWNDKFQRQIHDLRERHDKIDLQFANHKRKTEDELRGLVDDVSQLIDAMELLLKTAQAESHLREIRRMTIALKTKRTKATTAIYSIGLAKSEGQIDIALAEATNG